MSYMPLARCSLQLHFLPRSAARKTCLHQCAALQDPSCKIRALTHVLLVAAGATALSLDRRVALRVAAVAVACPSRPAKAVLACVDGQGPWCGGLEPATNDRAQSAEAVKAAYEMVGLDPGCRGRPLSPTRRRVASLRDQAGGARPTSAVSGSFWDEAHSGARKRTRD